MYKKDYRIAERIVIYLAERSIGKSIPMFSHKVNKYFNDNRISVANNWRSDWYNNS